MTLDLQLWPLVHCVICGDPAEHALELLMTPPKGPPTSALVGFCSKHYTRAQRSPQWQELPIVEAAMLQPKGIG